MYSKEFADAGSLDGRCLEEGVYVSVGFGVHEELSQML
jgi:hypothetical protein